MADLSTLNGISNARNDLYNKLEAGDINEQRAIAQERILRGQVDLKGTIPMRLTSIVMKAKGPAAKFAEPLMRSLLGFIDGPDAVKALDSNVSAEPHKKVKD